NVSSAGPGFENCLRRDPNEQGPGRITAAGALSFVRGSGAARPDRPSHTQKDDGDDDRDEPSDPVESIGLCDAEQTSEPVAEQHTADAGEPVAPPWHSGASALNERCDDGENCSCDQNSYQGHDLSSQLRCRHVADS